MIAAAEEGEGMVARILAERPYLRRVAFALTRHDADADDLVQETVLRAYRAHSRLRPESCLRAWLATILKRAFLTMRQHRSRRPAHAWTDTGLPLDGDGRFAAAASQTNDAADFESVSEQLDERLRRAVADVPFIYRDPLCRHALEGLTYREIAQRLGVPRGTVMSRIFRARTRVRCSLGGPSWNRRGGVR
jgi:RNA polymerase sigma-70 factor (ECF subfamily)